VANSEALTKKSAVNNEKIFFVMFIIFWY